MNNILTLNLVYPDQSDIKFVPSKFPDGQQSIKLIQPLDSDWVKIYSRFSNFQDLELIICATAALRNLGVDNIILYIPYFLGGRSDRRFEEGSINYLKEVVAPIINLQNYRSVITLDPHSDVLEAVINNFDKIDNSSLVKSALSIINKIDSDKLQNLISPDAGALKKIYPLAKRFNFTSVITASKVRDLVSSKILHTDVPLTSISNDPQLFIIIDDICDGGRTFIEVAKAIRTSRPGDQFNDKIVLIVTHGIFSNGFGDLAQCVDQIYCTNSIFDINQDYLASQNIDRNFVKQFNVF